MCAAMCACVHATSHNHKQQAVCCALKDTSGGPNHGHFLVFSWSVFPFTTAINRNFCWPEFVSLGLHGDVLASQNGWVAESQQLVKVAFAQTS
jgi:hypothetical protein